MTSPALRVRGRRAACAALVWGGLWVLAALGMAGCSTASTTARPVRPGALTGPASWYGKAHHGQRTASGERFDMYALTAAHPTFPFGTRLRVVNLDNDREVEVRVIDRGPGVPGRIIDLSYAAARALGAVGAGVVTVRLIVLE
jgi:rare lipoprotein A